MTRFCRAVPSVAERGALLLGLALMAWLFSACERALVVAPTNARITLLATTNTLPLNGTTDLNAIVTDSTGATVANGTLVTFTTTLGRVEPVEARTEGGRATAKLIGGNVSGIATVTAASGASSAAPISIRIGAVVGKIELATIPLANGSVDILASAVDPGGLAVSGATITFTTTAGTLSNTTVFTDLNGQARTNLVTTQDATVTAFSGEARATVSVKATVVPGGGPLNVNLTANPANPQRLDNVQFTATVTTTGTSAPIIVRFEWDFGDGTTAVTTGNTTSHIYQINGRFVVSVRVVALDGSSGFSRIEIFAS